MFRKILLIRQLTRNFSGKLKKIRIPELLMGRDRRANLLYQHPERLTRHDRMLPFVTSDIFKLNPLTLLLPCSKLQKNVTSPHLSFFNIKIKEFGF